QLELVMGPGRGLGLDDLRHRLFRGVYSRGALTPSRVGLYQRGLTFLPGSGSRRADARLPRDRLARVLRPLLRRGERERLRPPPRGDDARVVAGFQPALGGTDRDRPRLCHRPRRPLAGAPTPRPPAPCRPAPRVPPPASSTLPPRSASDP